MDTSGHVFSWGDNTYGQLGNNHTGDSRGVPEQVQGMPKVKQISAGCDFSLALLENGKVYAWGRGIHGQLGTGNRATSAVPPPSHAPGQHRGSRRRLLPRARADVRRRGQVLGLQPLRAAR
ncbi:hypothetical protein AB0N28_22190 [Streptomyces sp. NPDC051130]|uniref:hypothetical protein n=1 Tax=Streptomyces sp. NPDC051130 TaxID=3157223 RepID=UPI00343E8145